MKKIFIIIICAAAAVVFGYGIHTAVTPVSSQELELGRHENAVSAKGYIVRDEIAYYADRSGRLYTNASVGARVAKDSLIYTIYDSGVDESVIKELNTLDKKIAAAREAQSTAGFDTGAISVESEIAARTAQIIEAGRGNDVRKIAQYKKDINSLRTNGSVVSSAEELTDYENQKSSVEALLGSGRSERYAENSGVFTTYHDGLEDALNAERAEEYTVEYIESLGAPKTLEGGEDNINQGDFVCSVVNNHTWSVLLIVPEESVADCETGDSVTVRFKNIAGEEKNGTIRYISGEGQNKDGKCFVIIECSEYFEGAYSYRSVDADVIFESYSGYRVPAQAVRTEGQTYKVIGIADNRRYDCDVEILYSDTDDGYAIVDSTDDAAHRLSSMDRILVGER